VSRLGNSFAVLTGEEVLVFDRSIRHIEYMPISSMVSSERLGMTFIADKRTIYYINHKNPSTPEPIVYWSGSNALALDAQHRLLADRGYDIMRYTYDSAEAYFKEEALFSVDQYAPSGLRGGHVRNILVGKDGAIWVMTALSVFRHADGQTEEFNFFKDPSKFPAPSELGYRILEAPDGRIFAMVSDEGHLYQDGIKLNGGLMVWQPEEQRFALVEQHYGWLMGTMTDIGANLVGF
jgi:hypothetical protein